MKKCWISIVMGMLLLSAMANGQDKPKDTVERIPQVEALIKKMTLEEKVGQMAQITLDVLTVGEDEFHTAEPLELNLEMARKAIVQYKVGSILNTGNNKARTREVWYHIVSTFQDMAVNETRLGIPVVYGIDAIHGTTYTAGATFFPQEIGQAATWNPELVRRGAEISAYETRASAIPWNFSPVLDLGRDPRFPRMWETFGEDVYLVSQLGVQMVKGYQGEDNNVSDPVRVAACLKHYLGYSVPVSGKDRTPALIPDIELRERHLPAFAEAVKAGAYSVMVNSGIVNGVPVHASYKLLTQVLKQELGFNGVVVTDWKDIENLHDRDRVAATQKEAVKLAINAGIDMSMIPYDFDFIGYLVDLVNEGEVPLGRVDDAVRRILNMKHHLGLFERPVTRYTDYPKFGSPEFEEAAYQSASESITLLKNEGDILPLPQNAKILVTGPNANSMRTLNGGWSYSWQGEKAEEFAGQYATILEAIQNKFGKENVTYVPGVDYNYEGKYWEEFVRDIDAASTAAKEVDYVVLCLGENSYAEKPGDLHDLSLSRNQAALAQEVIKSGKPVILVLNEGRPRIIREIVPGVKGILQSYLPGNFGGLAIADVLAGDVNPGGKLPYTYPMYVNTLLTYDHKPSEEQAKMVGMYDYESDFAVQFPFGFGLSYTTFEYSNLKLSSGKLQPGSQLEIAVTVTNRGKRIGKEVVQLYTSDLYASVTPDVKRLRRFEKIELEPNESKTVTFILTPRDLSFINSNLERVTEPGKFMVTVGELEGMFEYDE